MDHMVHKLSTVGSIGGIYVFNAQPSIAAHWIGMIGTGETADYFDSFGRHPTMFSQYS